MSSSGDELAHDKWLQVKNGMAEEQILNKALLKNRAFSRQSFAFNCSTHAINNSSTCAHI
jgi:hypothetical protein